MKLQVTVTEFSEPHPLEGEESESGETVERQCVECKVCLTNPNPLSSLRNVQVNVDVTTPIAAHPSTVDYPSIGKS